MMKKMRKLAAVVRRLCAVGAAVFAGKVDAASVELIIFTPVNIITNTMYVAQMLYNVG